MDRTVSLRKHPYKCGVVRTVSIWPRIKYVPASWRIQGEYDILRLDMAARSCRVTIQDLEGVAHTIEVTAEKLVRSCGSGARGVTAQRLSCGLPAGIVKVSVADGNKHNSGSDSG